MLAFKRIKLAIEAKPYQLGRFLVVGGLSTIVNYSSFYYLLSQMRWGYIHSASLGFLLGVLVGYYLNKAWTFGVEEANAFVFLKYLSVYIASLISGMTFLYFQVETLTRKSNNVKCHSTFQVACYLLRRREKKYLLNQKD